MATATATRVSLSDVARLAQVRRPVVSVWRSRYAGTEHPFPRSVSPSGEQELFDGAEVADWLTTTGRGNNPSARDDLAAFARPAQRRSPDEATTCAALTSLLCLMVVSGRGLGELTEDALLDLADEIDPDDSLLYRELEAVAGELPALAAEADQLADASMSALAAFEALLAGRSRPGTSGRVADSVSPLSLSLVSRIATSLAARDSGHVAFVDAMHGSSDLLLALAAEQADRGQYEILTIASDEPADRLARRRLRVHDIYREDIPAEPDGTFAVDRPVTHVASLPGPGGTGSDAALLAAIENVVVQMDDSQRGVVLAPASALCDGFADRRAVNIRADILRAGHLRAIVRLPKGLVPARVRQSLAIWVLGASHREDDASERRTMIADLGNVALGPEVVEDLITDVTAATGGHDLVRAHAFRFLRPVPTRALLAARRSLVAGAGAGAGAPHRPGPDAAALRVRLEQLQAALADAPAATPELPELTGAPPAASTVGAMVAAGRLRLVPGTRLDAAEIGPGGISVIGTPELAGQAEPGTRAIDPLLLAEAYPAARLTEPGDVVFCTSPRPAAIVDRDGASVVAFPARVLRIDAADPGGLIAEILAADINGVAPGAREWRSWPARRVSDTDRAVLVTAFAALCRAREAARRRLELSDELTDVFTHLATSRSASAIPAPTKGH